LPGIALDQLWQMAGFAERTLLAVSAMVAAVALAGLVAVVLSSLGERCRELAILRSVGAPTDPATSFCCSRPKGSSSPCSASFWALHC